MGFVRTHLHCPSCDSSDALSENENGSAYCFACGEYLSSKDYQLKKTEGTTLSVIESREPVSIVESEALFSYMPILNRGLVLDTVKKYGVKCQTEFDGTKENIVKYSIPYYGNNEIVATKTRVVSPKSFFWSGLKGQAGLFGQQLFSSGGKFITLCEGEVDAMSAYQILGSKWPVVSISSGAQSADRDVKDNLEYLESFDNVVICFDMDEPGLKAATRVARLLYPGKAKIMSLPEGFKDVNEMLVANQQKNFTESWWAAKTYTPSGVLSVSENREAYKNREKKPSIPYPWEGLTAKLEGIRQGELITLAGGTGLGKSSVTRELEHWLLKSTDDNIGIVALEESFNRTVDGIISIEANDKLHIDRIREQYTEEELDEFFNILYHGDNHNRVWIHAHFGTNDIESIFTKLRFMIVGCECKWVVVDHLHMLVSQTVEGDERRSIDSIMHRLRTLVEQTGVGLILVCHLRRIDGNKGHENGAETSLSHLRGSQSIAQLSDCVVTLERNQQSDDPVEAATTRIRVLKSRYTGDVGVATHLVYDHATGRLNELDLGDLEDKPLEDEDASMVFD